MGIIGDGQLTDAATISDTVNTASRMEGLTKTFGASILISEAAKQKLVKPAQFHFRFLGLVRVKGKQHALKIYECLDGLELIQQQGILENQGLFEAGLTAYYAQQFDTAIIAFKKVEVAIPKDKPTQLYLQQATCFLEDGIPADWVGEAVH